MIRFAQRTAHGSHPQLQADGAALPPRAILTLALWLLACVLVPLWLVGCGGGGQPAEQTAVSVQVGPAGGTVTGPDGVQVIIPAGALSGTTTIGIARNAAGAPDPLDAYPKAGPSYEFTPHGQVFNQLITIRAPVPSGATGSSLFMASPGNDWKQVNTVVTDGIGEWQRNTFSFGYYGAAICSVPSAMTRDPYWCVNDRSYARISATPTAALTQTSPPHIDLGDAGSYRVDQAADLQLRSHFEVAGNCTNVSVSFKRSRYNPATFSWGTQQTVATQSPPMVVEGGKLKGIATFNLATSYLDNGKNLLSLVVNFNCPKVLRSNGEVIGWDPVNANSRSIGDGMVVEVAIAPPSVFHSVGGRVVGLTGSGLVLQNNGGDNLSIGANGPFTFATPVGAGAPYAVSVLTQPSGQICSVQNSNGTTPQPAGLEALVTCIASAGNWQGPELRENSAQGVNGSSSTVVFDNHGNAFISWIQPSGTATRRVWAARYDRTNGWEAATLLDSGQGAGISSHIGFDTQGNAMAVWSEFDGTRYNVWARRYAVASGTWGMAELIENDNSGHAFDAHIAFDASGNALAVWQIATSSTHYRVMSNAYKSGAWQTPVYVDTGVGSVGQTRLSVFPDGTAVSVWVQANGTQQQVWSNRYSGSAWGTASAVSPNLAGDADDPHLSADGQGRATAVWTQNDSGRSDVYASQLSGMGWGTAQKLQNTTSAVTSYARIAMNSIGQAVATWMEESGGNACSLWQRTFLPGSGWATPTLLEAPNGCGLNSTVALNDAGDAVIVWPRNTVGTGLDEDMTAFHGSVNAGTWAGPTVLSQGNQAGAAWGSVAIDASGVAIAVWQQFDAARSGLLDLWSNVFLK